MISYIVPGGARYIFREGVSSKKLRDIFAHLVFPVRPIVPALRAPVVQRMAYPLAGKNFREAVGRPAVLPRTGARRDVNVTSSDSLVEPRIAGVRDIIDGIVEIKIVFVHPAHQYPQFLHPDHRDSS